MSDDFLAATAHAGRLILQQGGADALEKAATDAHGDVSTEALGQGAHRLLWRIRKFAQPDGQGLEKLDPERVLHEATEHARIFLERNPIQVGEEIRPDLIRLAKVASSQDPTALLRVVGNLS